VKIKNEQMDTVYSLGIGSADAGANSSRHIIFKILILIDLM
jgi:hypothetical protein